MKRLNKVKGVWNFYGEGFGRTCEKVSRIYMVNKGCLVGFFMQISRSLPGMRKVRTFINDYLCPAFRQKVRELITFGSKQSLYQVAYFGVAYSNDMFRKTTKEGYQKLEERFFL